MFVCGLSLSLVFTVVVLVIGHINAARSSCLVLAVWFCLVNPDCVVLMLLYSVCCCCSACVVPEQSTDTIHNTRSPVRLSTVGKRAFQVSLPSGIWNDLPFRVASAPSLAVFRQRLKTFLFSCSYQDTII